MMSLRFVGDLPVWTGLLLAVVAGMLAWRYYLRERDDLPAALRVLLPLLRSGAIFLAVMILTGPVLRVRTTTGTLGQVCLVLDATQSMAMHDSHMSLMRKVRVAEQLDWLPRDVVDSESLRAVVELQQALVSLQEAVDAPADNDGLRVQAARRLAAAFQEVRAFVSEALSAAIDVDGLNPLNAMLSSGVSADGIPDRMAESVPSFIQLVQAAHSECDALLQQQLESEDTRLAAAVEVFDQSTRWQRLLRQLSAGRSDLLNTLRQEHDLKVLVLTAADVVAMPIAGSTGSDAESLSGIWQDLGNGNRTDLTRGLAAAASTPAFDLQDAGNAAGAAVVMLTDGQHNSGPAPVALAAVLGQQNVPVYSVAYGASRQASDLAITDLDYPDTVFQSDQVRGTMTIAESISPGHPYVAQVRAGINVLWQQQLISQGAAARVQEFEFRVEELVNDGSLPTNADVTQHMLPLVLEATVVPVPEEVQTKNNSAPMRLSVITQSYRVLIVDGRSRWETRYLRNLFDRDEQWQVATVIAESPAGDKLLPRGTQQDQFPTSKERLFRFDLVIFGDVAPELLNDSEYLWLREFVETRGGGMIVVDGPRRHLQRNANESFTTLLPVTWPAAASLSTFGSLELTERGAALNALRLLPASDANRQLWRQLPPPRSLAGIVPEPGTEVLVEAVRGEQRVPVMVTRRFGAGRVLYIATDETWRWRYKAADLYHQRVWNQLAEFVMPRPFTVSDDFVSLDTGRVTYRQNDQVDIRTQLRDLNGQPQTSSTVDAVLWRDDRMHSVVTLQQDPAMPGVYRGRSAELDEGEYEVSIRASGYPQAALQARTEFVVVADQTAELTQSGINMKLLQEVAEESGGAVLREEDAGRLPQLLQPLSRGRVVESEIALWQSYWCFAAILVLLTAEWILRKRNGLL
jgi:hypothetical protein